MTTLPFNKKDSEKSAFLLKPEADMATEIDFWHQAESAALEVMKNLEKWEGDDGFQAEAETDPQNSMPELQKSKSALLRAWQEEENSERPIPPTPKQHAVILKSKKIIQRKALPSLNIA